MFPPQSTPSKRPKRRVESYRIYKCPYSACSQSSRPSPSSYEKATHGKLVGPTLSTPREDKYYNQYRPMCEVCPRDRGKGVPYITEYNLTYLALQWQFFIGAKLFQGTPWMRKQCFWKINAIGTGEIAWLPWLPWIQFLHVGVYIQIQSYLSWYLSYTTNLVPN